VHDLVTENGKEARSRDDLRVQRAVRRTAVFWALLAFVAWNAVFDRLIVVAGRQYIRDAVRREAEGSSLLVDEVMRPAVVRAFWIATAVGSTVGAIGVIAVRRKRRWQLRDDLR
jgi:hypothetical protein